MLDIQGLRVARGAGLQAHRICLPALQLGHGEVRAITGESGCGKSTLLEAIGLLLKPQALEQYRLGRGGLDIRQLLDADNQAALAQVRSQQLGFVLQNGGLLSFLKVRDNINLPRRLLGLPADSSHVQKAVDVLRLQPLLDKYPHALSIGERQRVACVRAIAHEPQLLLADEPTAALDPLNARRLLELLLGMVRELGLTALVVSHDWTLIDEFGLARLGAVSSEGETCFVPQA